MFACSLIGTARSVDRQTSALLSLPELVESVAIERASAVLDSLADVHELVQAGVPATFEPANTAIVDEAVGTLLAASDGKWPPTAASVDETALQRAQANGRARIVDGFVLVPLAGRGPAAHNWPVVLDLLAAQLEVTHRSCQRIVSRLHADVRTGSLPSIVWRIVDGAVEWIRATIARTLSIRRWTDGLVSTDSERAVDAASRYANTTTGGSNERS